MFRKYVFVRQDSLKDCGVAALLTIIKVYNGDISKEKLRILTKTNKFGTKAYDLIKVAKGMGFSAKGIKGDINNLISSNILLPCIAHVVINKSYEHYIVIHKVDKKRKIIIVADPNAGIKKYSIDEFSKIWSGTLLIFYPEKKILRYKNTVSIQHFLYELFIRHIKKLIIIFILSLFVTVSNIINSFYLKILIDEIIVSKSIYNLFIVSLIFILIIIFKVFNDYFRKYMLLYINKNIDLNIFSDIFKHIVMLPYCYYKNRTTGEIMSRINDLNHIKDIISKVFLAIFIDIILIILVGILLYLMNHNLFFISTIFGLIYLISSIIFNPLYDKYIINAKEKEAMISSYLIESINNYETVKGLNIHENIIDNIELKYNDYLDASYYFNYLHNIHISIKDVLEHTSIIIVMLIGSILVIRNDITLGMLLSFNALLFYFSEPLRNIIDMIPNIKYMIITLRRILELYEVDKEQLEIDYNRTINNLVGSINIKNLTFSYNDKDNILNNINLEIKEGEKILIVGPSGNGKSTLLKILMRYYKVNNNTILLGDIDINNYSLNSIRTNICYVSQHESLFADSIYNNITLGRSIDYQSFLEITKLTYVDKIYKSNPLNYDMLIEENAFNISGGERQRIIMARSLIEKKKIFLFDEIFNEMDNDLERNIILNILSLLRNKTILLVTHRIDNKDLFDKVVYIENGSVTKIEVNNKYNQMKGDLNERTY